MVSSCCKSQLRPSEQAAENICPEYTDTLYHRSRSVNHACSGMSLTISSGCDCLSRLAPALTLVACTTTNAYVYNCTCLCESGGDATSIFSSVHWVLPLCYAALFLWEAVVSSSAAESSGIAPALLPDPSPPAPTSVGETYKIPGRQLREAICKKRGAFLMDAMFIHLFHSPVTNGLISQLSHWHVILCFLMGRIPLWNISATV